MTKCFPIPNSERPGWQNMSQSYGEETSDSQLQS